MPRRRVRRCRTAARDRRAEDQIEKLRRALYGTKSEREARLLEQLELQPEELKAAATEDELAAERVTPPAKPAATGRRRPARKPSPKHLPRERVVVEAPMDLRLLRLSPDLKLAKSEARARHRFERRAETETLEVIPRQWKVIQTVREKFTCRDGEKISQPPAPFHPTPRGLAAGLGRGAWPRRWAGRTCWRRSCS